MNRRDRGFHYLGGYCYAYKCKDGSCRLYEGGWGDRAEDHTAGLEVLRDRDGKVIKFPNWEAVNQWFKDHR